MNEIIEETETAIKCFFKQIRAIYRFKQNIVQISQITRDYRDFRRLSFALLLHSTVFYSSMPHILL